MFLKLKMTSTSQRQPVYCHRVKKPETRTEDEDLLKLASKNVEVFLQINQLSKVISYHFLIIVENLLINS